MQKKVKNGWSWCVGMLTFVAMTLSAQAATPYDYAVKISATVSANPARITLNWVANAGASSYNISRKAINSPSWTSVAQVGGSATSWTDSNVASGQAYEYQITAPTSD